VKPRKTLSKWERIESDLLNISFFSGVINGIDLDKTRRSIDYFAKLIVANCHRIINEYGFSTQTISYEAA